MASFNPPASLRESFNRHWIKVDISGRHFTMMYLLYLLNTKLLLLHEENYKLHALLMTIRSLTSLGNRQICQDQVLFALTDIFGPLPIQTDFLGTCSSVNKMCPANHNCLSNMGQDLYDNCHWSRFEKSHIKSFASLIGWRSIWSGQQFNKLKKLSN